MKKIKHIYLFISSFLFFQFITILPLAAAGGHNIEIDKEKIATEGLSGLSLFLVNLFNDHRLLFAILVIVSMAIVGLTLSYLHEFILKMFGVQTGKIIHKE